MRVLTIGGSGNLSADVVARLLRDGHSVATVTRGQRPLPPGCEAIFCDRHDSRCMRAALAGREVNVVINFLGYTIADLQIDLDVFRGNLSQYIFISSATVYAKPHAKIPLSEAAPLGNRHSEYARQKQACEEWLRGRQEALGIPITIVRPSHTYSPQWIPNAVHSAGYTFAARLRAGKPVFVHDGGEGLWTLTATSDFADGLVGLVGCDAAAGETFNLTSDEASTWNAIYATIADAFGVEAPKIVPIPTDFICRSRPEMVSTLKGDKSEPGVFDCSKIRAAVPGFACRKSFREGMREAAAWFDADPARQSIDAAVDAVFEQVLSDWEHFTG